MKVAIFAFLLLLSHGAFAGTQCTSVIKGVALQPNGSVFLQSFKNWNWLAVCNVNHEANNTPPESCKAIYSLLLSAQMSGKQVSFWFNNGRTCSAESQKSWDLMRDWYFGPLLHQH